MTRIVHAILLGLIGAGVVHIAVLLMVPSYSERDAWSAISQQSNYYTVTRLDPPGSAPLIGSLDPLFSAVACRFDLTEGVVRLHGTGSAPYWSISVYDRTGQNIFSLNDRSSSQGALDFVIADDVQMVELRNALPAAFDRSVFVEANIEEGIVVARAFVPDESWEKTVGDYLQGITCTLH
ncbi:DUF1254 domain-containing protein [Mesorhizobium sp. CAU 1732]|uniref:DUF1254 domain-containing protein n=1 Tax=Mesorhizobium sp. CAU 1732 TaxID=3140358 RepID=UPI0032619E24